MKKTEDYYSVYYGNTSITSNVIYSLLALALEFNFFQRFFKSLTILEKLKKQVWLTVVQNH